MVDIKNYEGLYAITSCGRVWSYRSAKFLKQFKAGAGYYFVVLSKDGEQKQFYIHRLVAEHYLPNPLSLTDVDHIDNDKSHNYLNNLQWASHKENVQKNKGYKIRCIETGDTFSSMRAAAEFCCGNHHGIERALKSGKTYHNYHFEKI